MADPVHSIGILGYQVAVGPGLIDGLGERCAAAAPAHVFAIVTDDQVAPRWLSRAERALQDRGGADRVISSVIPAGEASKTRDRWSALTDWLLTEGCGRDTTVVALGGGVVRPPGLCGHVPAGSRCRSPPAAWRWTRPSANGVDTAAGKNLVGSFHQPAAVVVDPGCWPRSRPAPARRHGRGAQTRGDQ